nr:hypothetical protein Q903MT_gene6343 [Picea sitchensis]
MSIVLNDCPGIVERVRGRREMARGTGSIPPVIPLSLNRKTLISWNLVTRKERPRCS